jgi:hypothetical protein
MSRTKNDEQPENPDGYRVIPKSVLNDVNEHAVGGFALFCFDKDGTPCHITNFDTPAHALGMFKYIEDWATALHAVYLERAKENLRGLG